jgi:hypothetical protein
VVLSLGFLAVLAINGLGGTTSLPTWMLIAVTIAAVAVGAWCSRPAAACGLAGIAFLAVDGFAVDHLGVLQWHGSGDALCLGLLVAVAVSVSWERNRQIEDERLGAVRRELAEERAAAARSRRSSG